MIGGGFGLGLGKVGTAFAGGFRVFSVDEGGDDKFPGPLNANGEKDRANILRFCTFYSGHGHGL